VQFYFEKIQNGPGEFILKIKGVTAKGVQIFSIQKVSDDLPVNTSIHFDSASLQYITDSIIEREYLPLPPTHRSIIWKSAFSRIQYPGCKK
jgi:hypothetical protein